MFLQSLFGWQGALLSLAPLNRVLHCELVQGILLLADWRCLVWLVSWAEVEVPPLVQMLLMV